MFLPDFSINRPVAATMMVCALVVFGVIGLTRLGVSLYPDVDFPVVTITTVWENARPEEVDNEITDEMEDAISSVSGIKHMTSQSMQGRSRVTVEFELSKDLDVAAQEVRDKVSARLRHLPSDADAPVIDKLDINARPIMWISITGPYAIEEMTRIVDEQIRPLLQKIEGAGEIHLGGGREKEVQIWLYRERLAAYNIGVDEVIDAIRREHIELPGGKIESREKEFLIRTVGEFETPEAFNDLILNQRNNGKNRELECKTPLGGQPGGHCSEGKISLTRDPQDPPCGGAYADRLGQHPIHRGIYCGNQVSALSGGNHGRPGYPTFPAKYPDDPDQFSGYPHFHHCHLRLHLCPGLYPQ
jgi:HAE1 family hydrophobic/amphiphilic exporter-1